MSEDEVEERLDKVGGARGAGGPHDDAQHGPLTHTHTHTHQVVVLFRYLKDKDVYESYHKQYLAKRLLSSRSVSDEAERSMLFRFKTECGYQYTCKVRGRE